MYRTRSHHIAAALVLASLASAQTVVPDDVPDLQQAIDQAVAGETIVVKGGKWGPLTITKPIQIVGDPAPTLVGEEDPFAPTHLPAIQLAGPGSGAVSLARVKIGWAAPGFLSAYKTAAIEGGGFAELRIFESEVSAPGWLGLTGLGFASPGISVSVPTLWVEQSKVIGGYANTDDCWFPGNTFPDADPAIVAHDVVVLDSFVVGGSSPPQSAYEPLCGGGCPPGGAGGTGIVAQRVFHAASQISGGTGTDWTDCDYSQFCCVAPSGEALQVGLEIALTNDMVGLTPLKLGQSFQLVALTPAGFGLLLVSTPAPPTNWGAIGWGFLDPGLLKPLGLIDGTGQIHAIPVPNDPTLTGLALAFQVADGLTAKLTRPVGRTFIP